MKVSFHLSAPFCGRVIAMIDTEDELKLLDKYKSWEAWKPLETPEPAKQVGCQERSIESTSTTHKL